MKEFEIKLKNKHDKQTYSMSLCGETLEDAVSHADYWQNDGDKIATDYTITNLVSVKPIDYYPFTYEDAIQYAIDNKIKVIHAILQQDRMADFDKLDLIKVIVNESPATYIHLDTACRDALVDIINEDICDNIIELILEFTNPYEDLTEEEAGQIMSDIEANGYMLPIGFTPKDFVEAYHECEPEDDEDD